MNILAVDCCLKLTGVALVTDGVISGHVQGDYGRKQTSELPIICERLMTSANLAWDSLDYIALTNGPGYFTGIRVGAAYATGLAYASGAKIIPVSTLEMLPFTFRKTQGESAQKILTVIYAGHGFVYGSCNGFLEAGEYSHESVLEWLKKNPDAYVISDDPERTGLDVEITGVKPDVLSLCEIAQAKTDSSVSPSSLKICYYRAPQGVN